METDRAAILARIREIVTDVLHVQPAIINEGSRFTEDLGADSLDRLSLVMALEDAFGRTINDAEASGFTTVKAVIDFIIAAESAKAQAQ